MLRLSLYPLFAIFMVLSLYLIKFGGEIPLRTVYGLALTIYIFLFISRKSLVCFVQRNSVIAVALVLGLSGGLATLIGVGDFGDVINYIIKWILQPLIIMCLAYQVSFCLGPLQTFKIVLVTYGFTLLIAVLQGLEVSAAWEFRYFVNSLQGIGDEVRALDEIDFDASDGDFDDGSRARGISWSAIHLSYQACLVIGMVFLSKVDQRYQPLRLDKFSANIILALAIMSVIFSGTRSALIGVVVLPLLYFFWKSKHKLLVSVVAAGLITLIVFVLPLMQEALNLRVLQAQDSSANMRLPLYLFGAQLFLDQPWGYGWIDQSVYYAQDYWQHYRHMEGAESIFLRGLHNYALNIVWVYGVFGLAAIVYLLASMKVSFGPLFLIALAPYFINSLFHNGGVFYGGNYIWVFIGIAKYLYDQRVSYRRKLISNNVTHLHAMTPGFTHIRQV